METTKYDVLKSHELIRNFSDLIDKLLSFKSNVVIGGTCALELHGLKIGREIEDLDLIIYQANDKQKDILNTLEAFSRTQYYGADKRTIKVIGKYDMVLNIIKEDTFCPSDLLLYRGIPIQNIGNVFKAKQTYTGKKGTEYMRVKDMRDSIKLKELNFNLF